MFIEEGRFPECVSLGATGGPGWITDIMQVESGFETRNRRRLQSLGEWEVAHAARRPVAWKALKAWWMVTQGRWAGFRFKDPLDYLVEDDAGVFVQLTATTFQLYKRYELGANYHDRKIQKPVSPISITGGVSPTVDYTTGIVTVGSGTPTRWTGEFDVPCRFGIDKLEHEFITRTGDGDILVTWRSIPIREIRV